MQQKLFKGGMDKMMYIAPPKRKNRNTIAVFKWKTEKIWKEIMNGQ